MKRVIVIGSGGAGKTVFARRLAERTRLPLIHLDTVYWRNGWTPTPAGEWDAVLAELLSHERWVIDGNYGRTLAARLAACDTVIFLDVPRLVCTYRVLRRRLEYAWRKRPELAEGCGERLGWEFMRWVWSYPRLRRPRILEMLTAVASEKRVLVLRDQADIDAFLDSLPEGRMTP